MNQTKVILTALLLLGSTPAWAAPASSLDRLVARAHDLRGPQFLQLGEELEALGPEAKADLRRKVNDLRFTTDGWRRDLDVVMLDVLVHRPTEVSRLDGLSGLEPRVYLSNRRPEPSVGTELKAMKLDPALLFLAHYQTAELYRFAERGQYPAALSDEVQANLRKSEMRALRHGLLIALGASGHPAAARTLAEVALDRRQDEATRGLAAAHLGQTREVSVALPALQKVLEEPKASTRIVTSALAGLGHLRTEESRQLLVAYTRARHTQEVRQSAIAGLGTLGSAWVAAAQPTTDGVALRARTADVLVDLLLSPEGAAVEVHLLEALTRTGEPQSLARLVAARDGATDEGVRARAQRASARLELALARQR
jgi:hypothetical protein